MFKKEKWSFVGVSGTQYDFAILPKSQGLPQAPGVFILAYTRPRGHVAGWQVTPLSIHQADNMRLSHKQGTGQERAADALWNSNFVLLESEASAREQCVRDLSEGLGADILF